MFWIALNLPRDIKGGQGEVLHEGGTRGSSTGILVMKGRLGKM